MNSIAQDKLINAFVKLGEFMQSTDEQLAAHVHRASVHNPWFTKENIAFAFKGVADQFLQAQKLEEWLDAYNLPTESPRKVGLIMAGNIPIVGFHDLLAVLFAGHQAIVKLSERDPYLLPFLIEKLNEFEPETIHLIDFQSRLKDFDAVIATGSDNSARYFKKYFKDHPHIIRKNRNAIAVLTGEETESQLKNLAKDVFLFFGLGCRNVSHIFVPHNYNFEKLVEAFSPYAEMANHSKYRNNIDYNSAVNILNKVPHISLSHLMLIEKPEIISRIGTLHYTYYADRKELSTWISERHQDIQCVVGEGNEQIDQVRIVPFGMAQNPSLFDYADGIDVMKFLSDL